MKIKSTVIAGFTIAGALFVGASFSNAGSLQSQFGIKSTMFKPLQAQAFGTSTVQASTQEAIPFEQMTTKEVLSQTYPLVSSYEVLNYDCEIGVYNVRNISDGHLEKLALEGTYQSEDIVIVLFKGDDGEEIAGETKLDESAKDLNKQYYKGNLTTSKDGQLK